MDAQDPILELLKRYQEERGFTELRMFLYTVPEEIMSKHYPDSSSFWRCDEKELLRKIDNLSPDQKKHFTATPRGYEILGHICLSFFESAPSLRGLNEAMSFELISRGLSYLLYSGKKYDDIGLHDIALSVFERIIGACNRILDGEDNPFYCGVLLEVIAISRLMMGRTDAKEMFEKSLDSFSQFDEEIKSRQRERGSKETGILATLSEDTICAALGTDELLFQEKINPTPSLYEYLYDVLGDKCRTSISLERSKFFINSLSE